MTTGPQPLPGEERWSEDALARMIGRLLRIGVLVAAAVVAAGGAALIARHGGDTADFHTFRGPASPLRDLGAIVRGARQLDSRAIVQLGLVLLIATPVARVALTFVTFLIRRDRLYTLLTFVVFALLIASLVWGGA